MSWTTILSLAAGTLLLKAVGPLLAGGRAMPPWLERVVDLLPAALLAALIAVQTFGEHQRLVLDARAAGLALAGASVLLRAPFIVVVLAGMLGAAAARAVF